MLKNKLLVIICAIIFGLVFSTEAFAGQGRIQNGRESGNRNEVQHNMERKAGDRDKGSVRDGWILGGVVLAALTFGAIIAASSRQHEAAYVEPVPVVADPVGINVPNARGGYTLVSLTRCQGGYLGPQGEYYAGNPTLGQLRVLYGE